MVVNEAFSNRSRRGADMLTCVPLRVEFSPETFGLRMGHSMRGKGDETPVIHPVTNLFSFVAGDGMRMQITDEEDLNKFRSTFADYACFSPCHIFLSELPTNIFHDTNVHNSTMKFYSFGDKGDTSHQINPDDVVVNAFFEVTNPVGLLPDTSNMPFGLPLMVGRVVQSVLVHSFPFIDAHGSGDETTTDLNSPFDVVVCANPTHEILRFHVPNLSVDLPTLAKLRWSLVHALIAEIGVVNGRPQIPTSQIERLDWGGAVLDFFPGSGIVMVGAFTATACRVCVRRNKGERFDEIGSHRDEGETTLIYEIRVPKCRVPNCNQGLVLPTNTQLNSSWRVMPLGELLWRNKAGMFQAVRNPDSCTEKTPRHRFFTIVTDSDTVPDISLKSDGDFQRDLVKKCGIQARSPKASPGFSPDTRYALVPRSFQLCVQPTKDIIRPPNPRVVSEFLTARYFPKIWIRDPRFKTKSVSMNEQCFDKSRGLPQMVGAVQEVLARMGELRGEWKGLILLSAMHWSRTIPASNRKKRGLHGLPIWNQLNQHNRCGWFIRALFVVSTTEQANQGTPDCFCMAHCNEYGIPAPKKHTDTAIVLEIHPPRCTAGIVSSGFAVQVCDECLTGSEGFRFEYSEALVSKMFSEDMC